MKTGFTIKRLSMIGVMAALCFAASTISINIPTGIGNTRLHLGNVLCLMSGMLLGPIDGGLSAGIGSMFYDFTNPIYTPSAPFTLVFKFLMAFVCGSIARHGGEIRINSWRKNFLAAAAGAATYIILYLGKNFIEDMFFLRAELETTIIDVSAKAAVSGFNGLLAVLVSVPLAFALRKGLESAGIKGVK